MPEWWSYGLGDFLLFSPRTYYRLIERYNSGLWPLHLVALAAGIALLAVQRRPTPGRTRAACAILAIAWAWVGWAFLHRRYATINWAAEYFACGFAVEAVLLAVVAGRPDWLRLGDRRGPAALIGTVVLALALVYPVMAPLAGRPWASGGVLRPPSRSDRHRHPRAPSPRPWIGPRRTPGDPHHMVRHRRGYMVGDGFAHLISA